MLALEIAIAIVVVYFIAKALRGQWADFQTHRLAVHARWGWIVASTAAVLATYLALIETWRRIIAHWGGHIAFADAARVWFASNLAKYIPGAVAQLGAIGYMARSDRLSGVAASGAAVLNVVVNLATGTAIALLAGSAAMRHLPAYYETVGIAFGVASVAGLALLPRLLPWLVAVAGRVTGRRLVVERLPARAVIDSAIGNLVAWAGYGVALQFLVLGLFGDRGGSTLAYVAAFAAAYVVGYLVLIMPGGAGVREGTLILILPALVPGLSTAEAGFVAIASRIIMTVLDLVPGLVYLARTTALERKAGSPR